MKIIRSITLVVVGIVIGGLAAGYWSSHRADSRQILGRGDREGRIVNRAPREGREEPRLLVVGSRWRRQRSARAGSCGCVQVGNRLAAAGMKR